VGVQNLGLLRDQDHLKPSESDPEQVAAECVKHLEQHPLDTEARERLAVIYADHYKRLDLATGELEQKTAEDILQETSQVICEKFDTFREGTDFMAWACEIAWWRVRAARQSFARSKVCFSDEVLSLVAETAANLQPGDHTFEARRDGFLPKRIQRSLTAGESLNISGAELAQVAATGSLHLSVTPADAAVSYRRSDESQAHTTRDTTLKLEPGTYTFTVRAPNYLERTATVTVVAGETRTVEVALVKPEAPKPRPTLNWAGWAKEGDEFVRKGGNRVVVCSGPMNGTLTFVAHLVKAGGVFRGGRLRWFIEDATGGTQYEVDKRHFQAKGPAGSRSKDRGREQSDANEKTYAVEIDFTPDRIVHKMQTAEGWVTVDSQPAKVAGDTKFGFVIPGNDEISISDLRFAPR